MAGTAPGMAPRFNVEADGRVTWGPNPADVEAIAEALQAELGHSLDNMAAARIALTVMHERGQP